MRRIVCLKKPVKMVEYAEIRHFKLMEQLGEVFAFARWAT